MGDPDLRNDEKILLRTPGVCVKSIPFEGILTNKRIILVDRATNLLPPKDIPLVTVKDVEGGENAIRDQILRLSVLTKTGETRQMILTFSRQAGGNRIKERDTWLKTIKDNTSSTFDQVIRKVIPGSGQAPKKSGRRPSPRIEVIRSPMVRQAEAEEKTAGPKEQEKIPSVKRIIETRQVPVEPAGEKTLPGPLPLQLGTYCSRCGARVPEGSGFCNRCGSKIFVAGSGAAPRTLPVEKSPPMGEEPAPVVPLANEKITASEPLMEHPVERIEPWVKVRQEPEVKEEPEPVLSRFEQTASGPYTTQEKTDDDFDSSLPVIFDSGEPKSPPPQKNPAVPPLTPRGTGFKPGKKMIIGIIAVIIIIAVLAGGFFLFPIIAHGADTPAGNGSSLTPHPTIVKNSGSAVLPTQTLKPTLKPTSPGSPGNRPANTGL
jgi:DNA-directed RNA polymerase subunit RPC12/RpoP